MVRTEHVVNELRRLADHGDGIGETDRRVIRKAADLLDAPEGSFHSLDTMLRIMANHKRFKENLDILTAEITEAKKDLAIFNILKNEMDRVRASAEWLLAQAESKLADAEAKLARAHSEAKRLE